MNRDLKRVEIKVFGRVQGVFFRDEAYRRAKKLELYGWVKNEKDGSVKIVVEGLEDNLKKLIEWSKRGPLLARVDKIEVKWKKGTGEFKNFEITYKF